MVTLNRGAVKFKSIKAAAKAAGIPYMTFYMRHRADKPLFKKVRKYRKAA